MPRYIYTGPNSSVTLKVSDGKGGLKDQDVLFWNGQEVELPATHEMAGVLLAQGYLKPIAAAPAQLDAPAAADAKKSGKTK
jgi:hypothetical protein